MNSPADASLRASLRVYVQDFVAFGRQRILTAFILLFAAGLVEGLSLLLLIPLLGLTGFLDAAQQRSTAAELVARALGLLRIDFGLGTVLTVFVLVVAIEAWLSRKRSLTMAALELSFTDHLRSRLYDAIGRAEWVCHLRERSADAIHLLDETVSNIGFGTYSILQLAVFAVQSSIYLAIALSSSPALTLVMAGTASLLLLVFYPLHRRAFRKGQEAVTASQALYRSMAEFFAGMKIVKILGAEATHVDGFNLCATRVRESQLAMQASNASAHLGFRIASAIILSLFIYYAVRVLKLPAEVLIVLIFLAHRLLGIFSSAQTYWQYILQMLPSHDHYQAALQRYREAAETIPAQPLSEPLAFKRSLELIDLGFSYVADAPVPTLQHINLRIRARETVALIGPSGAGKSTLADLILGLLVPDAGAILIDGQMLDPDRRRGWRQQVAYVPQDVYLFHESIRDNLLRARPQASDQQLREVLQQAAATAFIDNLPGAWDCVIGDRGVRLSGGERQRLALARALLREPAVLILDEATSALDLESERQIHRAILQLHGSLTILIIAHRLSTIQHADQIAIIERGTVVETGRWAELLASSSGRLRGIIADSSI